VAQVVGAKKLIFLTDVDGLYNGDPREEGNILIPDIRVVTMNGDHTLQKDFHQKRGRHGAQSVKRENHLF